MSYIEQLGDSRGFNITTDSITQTFVYRICLDEDLDQDDGDFGAFFTPNDDAGLALFAYSTFPSFRTFPLTASTTISLYLLGISAKEDSSGWIITLTYGIPPLDQADGGSGLYVQFGLEIGAGTYHINKSLEVVDADPWDLEDDDDEEEPPDNYGLIGLNKDKIEGADILAKGLKFNITGYYTADIWSISVLLTFYSLQATYNNATFKGFSAGEVLLESISAQGDQYKLIPVTFSFVAKPNISGLVDLPFPTLTALGHHLVDYSYIDDPDNDFPIQIPKFRYIHRVYEPGNFSLLGI